MSKKITDQDKYDWQSFISNKQKLPDKDSKTSDSRLIELKTIDLHGYSLEEANRVIEKFIIKSFNQRVKKLIVVTGKGLHSQNDKDPYSSKDFGILKYSVPEYISKNNSLMKLISSIEDAKIEDGGSGAFYIYLKRNK